MIIIVIVVVVMQQHQRSSKTNIQRKAHELENQTNYVHKIN